jgi:hypothetical protein
MPATQELRKIAFSFIVLTLMALPSERCRAQAALLMEEPYGFFGSVNPTGHNAVYFERVCAETPLKLRRCRFGESGAVISRYQGINGVDWVAIPLLPYLYSVENGADVPARVDRQMVQRLRSRYREAHLLPLSENLPPGGFTRGGWTQLVGVSYERRIYAFRFETTAEQDDAFIARMNSSENRSHFSLLLNNCSDFARLVLNLYFPGAFQRSTFPDAGMTTPKQIAYRLERYARRHPEMQLSIYEIPQIPGYRRQSHRNKSIAESLVTTGYAIPIALVNPYLAGGLVVDYIVRGRHSLIPKHPQLLAPDNLLPLTAAAGNEQNPLSAGIQASGAAAIGLADARQTQAANFGLTEMKVAHE